MAVWGSKEMKNDIDFSELGAAGESLIGAGFLELPESTVDVKVHKSKPQQKKEVKKKVVIDAHGAIIRGDTTKKEIALVFTGDEFADGGAHIADVLSENQVKAAFFFTGNFYANPEYTPLIRKLRKDDHFLGAHSDQHLLYAAWEKRDSLLLNREEFMRDLQNNYKKMEAFGLKKEDAPFFLPPYEWYNTEIARWTQEAGLQLINFSPGTLSSADYTYPEMGQRYRSSNEILRSILALEAGDPMGLNGFILLLHIGTDPRRTDKFYNRLDELIKELRSRGYSFVELNTLLNPEHSKR